MVLSQQPADRARSKPRMRQGLFSSRQFGAKQHSQPAMLTLQLSQRILTMQADRSMLKIDNLRRLLDLGAHSYKAVEDDKVSVARSNAASNNATSQLEGCCAAVCSSTTITSMYATLHRLCVALTGVFLQHFLWQLQCATP